MNRKSLLIISIFLVSLVFQTACKSTHQDFREISFQEIKFGEGGGFSGLYKFYILNKSGQLYSIEKDSSLAMMKTIEQKELYSIDSLTQKLIRSGQSSNAIGNMTYYVDIISADSTYQYKYGDDPSLAPEHLGNLYPVLRALVGKVKFEF